MGKLVLYSVYMYICWKIIDKGKGLHFKILLK